MKKIYQAPGFTVYPLQMEKSMLVKVSMTSGDNQAGYIDNDNKGGFDINAKKRTGFSSPLWSDMK